ncbi:MGMT family protein [Candidatus Woesebacteria bacterium]|nr:MGMT family protein [Candidatus Woesebacteria bacterium]
MSPNLFDEVYSYVKIIPPGKVMTYGQVARALGIKDTRKVGWALHASKSSEVPCHRVVNKEGRLAENFAFNGAGEQRKRLLSEGVKFIDDMHVDLKTSLQP